MKVGHVLVHVNCHPFSLEEHFDRIIAGIVEFLEKEKIVNTVRSLRKGSKASQKIAIA